MSERANKTRLALAVAAAFILPVTAAGGEELVRIGREDCLRLQRHVPDANVAYKPGMDVRGKPVAPADLGGGAQLNLPAEIAVIIEVDLAERYGLPVRPGLYDGKAQVGTVTVRDGTALFNGQPMHEFDQHLIAEACRDRMGR